MTDKDDASEAFVALALAALPLVMLMEALPLLEAVGVAVAGILERAGSAVKLAVRPVTLLQTLGGAIVPATKFTAAHCRWRLVISV